MLFSAEPAVQARTARLLICLPLGLIREEELKSCCCKRLCRRAVTLSSWKKLTVVLLSVSCYSPAGVRFHRGHRGGQRHAKTLTHACENIAPRGVCRITSIVAIWWNSSVSSSHLSSQLETVNTKWGNYQKHHCKYNLRWEWRRRGLFPRSSLKSECQWNFESKG